MNYEYLAGYGALSLISGLILYIFRDIVGDIKMLRTEIQMKVTEQEVRQIVDDRLESLHQNLASIKENLTLSQEKVDRIIDVLIKK
jgi:hypothetical protein